MKKIKDLLKNNRIFIPFIKLYKKLKKRFEVLIGRAVILKVSQSDYHSQLISLGTEYGGWTFVNVESLNNSTIISAGLGEDASFDVEFAAMYKSRVIIVDPTPRAINHFQEITQKIGNLNTLNYPDSGALPASSYNLSKIAQNQLILEEKALWNSNDKIKFFEPPNPEHVSYSINNFQNNYSKTTDFIEVDSITISGLAKKFNLNVDEISLLKMDIEGAEIEVIDYLCNEKIYPKQLLIEFDELNRPSRKGANRIRQANLKLCQMGYTLIWTDDAADFLYVHDSLK